MCESRQCHEKRRGNRRAFPHTLTTPPLCAWAALVWPRRLRLRWRLIPMRVGGTLEPSMERIANSTYPYARGRHTNRPAPVGDEVPGGARREF